MLKKQKDLTATEKSFGIYLSTLIATVVTFWFQTKTQDPFNIPKFSILIVLSPFMIYVIANNAKVKKSTRIAKMIYLLLGFFLTSFLAASFLSENIYQSFIGLYQRNLGFLTYFAFALLFLCACLAITHKQVNKLLNIFISTGALEALYGLIQYWGLDPFKWKNPYSPIIGTFGNPNFQSAFLGITSAAALGLVLRAKLYLKTILALQIMVSLFLVNSSNSIQGFMSFGIAASVILLNYLRLSYNRFWKPASILTSVGALIAVLGTLGNGPASFLHQASISARGDYWRAAIAMFKAHPFTGVGIERYGDYFGIFRDLRQVRGRSFATFSDNAHNVFLHFAATGGFFLVISYLLLISIIVAIAIKTLKVSKNDESQNISVLLGIYCAFLAISFISPENVGFTSWSWLFGGGLIGLCIYQQSNEKVRSIKPKSKFLLNATTFAAIATLFLMSVYLVQNINKADKGIWNAYSIAFSGSGTLEDLLIRIENVTETVPQEQRYKLLASSMAIGLDKLDLAEEYADQVLQINSQSVDAYKLKAISNEKQSDFSDGIKFRLKMLELDPLNLENIDKLARIEFERGNYSKAKEYLSMMKKIQSSNSLVSSLSEYLKTK